MRLLVVGGNPLMSWIVRHLVPEAVEVEQAATLEQARREVLGHPPDAVLVQVMPPPCPWREIVELCRHQRPPIPTLFHSGAYLDPVELGIPGGEECFSTEPSALRRHLGRLIHAAGASRVVTGRAQMLGGRRTSG